MSQTNALAFPDLEVLHQFHFEDDAATRPRPLDPAKANYFAVFGMAPRLCIDTERTRDAFLLLSRKFHPDYFATADEATRAESLRRSSLINNAWKTLRDPKPRAEYLISLLGPGIESNKNAVPPELLEEMFDIQEAGEELREARLATDPERLATAEARITPLRAEVEASRKRLDTTMAEQFARIDNALNSEDPTGLQVQQSLRQLRTLLDQGNYLRTVLRNLR